MLVGATTHPVGRGGEWPYLWLAVLDVIADYLGGLIPTKGRAGKIALVIFVLLVVAILVLAVIVALR